MHVHVYVHANVRVHASTDSHMYVHVNACICMCMRACMHVRMCACMQAPPPPTYLPHCACVHVYRWESKEAREGFTMDTAGDLAFESLVAGTAV